MAKPAGATQAKRARERAKQEKAQEKKATRLQRKEQKKSNGDRDSNGEDPDLAGIVAGPQPPMIF